MYNKITLKEEFNITKIITMHYYEFAKDFVFSGEKHDFWEFLYVDEGEVEVTSENNGFLLHQGELIFHKPNEFHSVWANKKIAPNVVVMCFECNSPSMSIFKNKIYQLGDKERNYLSLIVKEGYNSFLPPLGDPEKNILKQKDNSIFGSEQLIKNYLEILFITLVRQKELLNNKQRLSSIAKERSEREIIKRIIDYMHTKIDANISQNEFCNIFNISKTHLFDIFKRQTKKGIMEYFRNLKMERAKILIREGKYNFTEISELLGYSSIHYFSRYFKKNTGFTPSEYSKSIKARI